MKTLKKLLNNKSGQGLVEYALILAVVAAVVAGVMLTMGDSVKEVFQGIINQLSGSTSS